MTYGWVGSSSVKMMICEYLGYFDDLEYYCGAFLTDGLKSSVIIDG